MNFSIIKKKLKKRVHMIKKQYFCDKLNGSVKDPKTNCETFSKILRPTIDCPSVKIKK